MIANIHNMSIEQKILHILKEKFNCGEDLLAKQNWNIPLTWEPFNFSAVELMYLFMEMEKTIGIRISRQYLHDYGFSTIEKVINIACATEILQ